MIYVILGMHKSGTTLTSQILHHSGINMGESIDDGTDYDRGNKYEREATKAINIDILRTNGYHESDWHKVVTGTLSKSETIFDPNILTDEQGVRMKNVINNCNVNHDYWGFKDPRTCITYPLWASQLPEHRIIAIFRSYAEQWQRHKASTILQLYREPYKIGKFVEKWCRYNANIITYLQQTKMDFLILDYQKLMSTTSEFSRLQTFVGKKLRDRRQANLYRNHPKSSLLVKLTSWMVYKQTGNHPQKLIEQLEALR